MTEDKQPPIEDDVEKAAEDYVRSLGFEYHEWSSLAPAFIAGAKWDREKQQGMKSKEEILNKHCNNYHDLGFPPVPLVAEQMLHAAMEEYAAQFSAPKQQGNEVSDGWYSKDDMRAAFYCGFAVKYKGVLAKKQEVNDAFESLIQKLNSPKPPPKEQDAGKIKNINK